MKHARLVTGVVAALVASFAQGCAGYPAPQQHLAESIAAVRGAQELGAANQPQAALTLRLAQEEIVRAKELMDDGKNEGADFMTLRAKADAELAAELTRQADAKTHADQSKATEKAVQAGARVVPVPPPAPALPAPPAAPPVNP